MDELMLTSDGESRRADAARAWLDRVRRSVAYERTLRRSAEARFEAADGLRAIDYSRDAVSGVATGDAIPNAVIAHESAGEAIAAIADEAASRIAEAARAIATLDDPYESRCLHLYYIDALDTWDDVCSTIGYTYDGVMKLHRRALVHVYDHMPHIEREPFHQAI